jgi:hypothetical protein
MPIEQAKQEMGTPLGLPGSGRLRYAAAMALYRAGELDANALEIYRICAPLDNEDPAPLLAADGNAAQWMAHASEPPWDLLFLRLLTECDAYLAEFDGPGIAETRNGLSDALIAGPTQNCHRRSGADNPVASDLLGTTLDSLSKTHPVLAGSIADCADHLRWESYDAYPASDIGADFATSHAFAELIGPGCPFEAEDFNFGLFLMRPHLLYRDHAHPAPELYVPLTGTHGWRFGVKAPLLQIGPHVPIWNAANEPHMTKTGAEPFLSLYCWTRDTSLPARVLPAPDWDDLMTNSSET